jgi:hypothetical protein
MERQGIASVKVSVGLIEIIGNLNIMIKGEYCTCRVKDNTEINGFLNKFNRNSRG